MSSNQTFVIVGASLVGAKTAGSYRQLLACIESTLAMLPRVAAAG